jgi:hypothetical protein
LCAISVRSCRRNRGFACAVHELVQMVGGIQDAYRRHTDCGSASVMVRRNPSWIGSLVKFPERLYPWVDTLRTLQQFTADTGMRNRSLSGDDRTSDSDRALGIIGGLADSPLMLCIACIPRITEPGGPSKPRMPSGYQRRTSACDNISVCFPIASPVAIPLRQPLMRSIIRIAPFALTGAIDRTDHRQTDRTDH